jgi:hypothetical protein
VKTPSVMPRLFVEVHRHQHRHYRDGERTLDETRQVEEPEVVDEGQERVHHALPEQTDEEEGFAPAAPVGERAPDEGEGDVGEVVCCLEEAFSGRLEGDILTRHHASNELL